MITPDELIKQILDANQGDGRSNVMDYATTLLRRWEQEVRQDEIKRCAVEWANNPFIKNHSVAQEGAKE